MNRGNNEKGILFIIWRILSPLIVLFFISQIAGSLAGLCLMKISGAGKEVFIRHAELISGISSLFIIVTALYLYRKDETAGKREERISQNDRLSLKLNWKEAILLVVMGAAYAQYGSLIVKIIKDLLGITSMEGTAASMMGESMLLMIVYVGIIGPIAEEMTFRWLVYLRMREYMPVIIAAVSSGVLFGAYHMNVTQGIYASILGVICAWVMEKSRSILSCILFHSGANIFSVVVSQEKVSSLLMRNIQFQWSILLILLAVLTGGIYYYARK